MPGIHDTHKIDLIIKTKDDQVEFLILEENPWTGTEEHIKLLLEKLKTYINYILGGQFKEMYPDLAQRKVLITVQAKHEFDAVTKQLFESLKTDLKSKHQIDLEVKHPDKAGS